jgi:hypothetical protein
VGDSWNTAALINVAACYGAAMFGAFVLYMLNCLNNRKPFSLFNAIQVSTNGRPILTFVDMLVSSGIGAGIVILLTKAGSINEAVTGGLGLTGILSAFGKDTHDN